MTTGSQCSSCVHFKHKIFEKNTCEAYPDEVPKLIFFGQVDHRKPYKDDHGIQWKAVRGLEFLGEER